MSVLQWFVLTLAVLALTAGAALALFTLYVIRRYTPTIRNIFETKPLFVTPTCPAPTDAEAVSFTTASGRILKGDYLKHLIGPRKGVILFCHEYSANRWLFEPYVGFLRAEGFDIFTFDFCNHGQSDAIADYQPLQWVTDHEVEDVNAALAHLRGRPDADPRGVGVFGVSKGGSAGIAAASSDRSVRAVITDGAFPTHDTVVHYETRWIKIYLRLQYLWPFIPRLFYVVLCDSVLKHVTAHRRVNYPRLERAIRRLRGRPLLMIHGGRDNYIHKDIIERFFGYAGQPKELWIVAGAKHNGNLEKAGAEYRRRVSAFFRQHLANETMEPVSSASATGSAPAALASSDDPPPTVEPTTPMARRRVPAG